MLLCVCGYKYNYAIFLFIKYDSTISFLKMYILHISYCWKLISVEDGYELGVYLFIYLTNHFILFSFVAD